jgi:hypothetical protein
MRKILIKCAAALLMIAGPANAATLLVSNNELVGATGVNIGGTLYNVSFVEGTCASVYGSCASSNFDFTTQASALLAAQSLLDQVFLDIPGGQFDSLSELTYGCELMERRTNCAPLIPYSTEVLSTPSGPFPVINVARAVNVDGVDDPGVFVTDAADFVDTSTIPNAVWARFTVSPVPEPASWATMILGFGVIGGALRSRRMRKPLAALT